MIPLAIQERTPWQPILDNPTFYLRDHQSQKIEKLTLYKQSLRDRFSMSPNSIVKDIQQIFPRTLSLDESKRKMYKNLFKASCEHWNLERKLTGRIIDTTLTLDELLLTEIKTREEELNKESIENQNSILKQMELKVINLVFSSKNPIFFDIRKTWSPESLHKEWKEEEQLLSNPYIRPDILHSIGSSRQENPEPLTFVKTEYSDIGMSRPRMEDAHFCISLPEGTLLGVFDGHGGDRVAKYANTQFQEGFSDALSKANGNPHQAFEFLFDKVEKEIHRRIEWMFEGSTAIVSFIDKKNTIFTATLGDSVANIYRKINKHYLSVPLSVARDWSSHKEAKRAAESLRVPSIETCWFLSYNPKELRLHGLNVSRTLGDVSAKLSSPPDSPGIICKPKITMHHLRPDDLLVLSCDGLKDYSKERAILQILSSLNEDQNPAEALGTLAKSAMTSHHGDNITIIALKAMETASEGELL